MFDSWSRPCTLLLHGLLPLCDAMRRWLHVMSWERDYMLKKRVHYRGWSLLCWKSSGWAFRGYYLRQKTQFQFRFRYPTSDNCQTCQHQQSIRTINQKCRLSGIISVLKKKATDRQYQTRVPLVPYKNEQMGGNNSLTLAIRSTHMISTNNPFTTCGALFGRHRLFKITTFYSMRHK